MSQTQRRRRSAGGRVAHTPPALSVDGQFFRNHGERWTAIESSEFTLPKHYMVGTNIRPILDERAEIGFNLLRLWVLNQSVVGQVYPEGIHPNQYPDFYDRLRSLVELIGSYGMAAEITAFTSCIPLMPKVDDQVRHWTRLQDCVRGLGNVALELVNEWDWGHGENAPDRSLWDMRPKGIISSSGSSTADAPPPKPLWDYGLYHANDLDQWPRKVAHNPMEDIADTFGIPGFTNESTRYPDKTQSTQYAYDAAAGAALLCAGSCFHSQGGKFSRPFDAVELAAAKAWASGANSVPLEFQAGRYVHRIDLEDHVNETVLRAYERVLPDGRSHLVLIHY